MTPQADLPDDRADPAVADPAVANPAVADAGMAEPGTAEAGALRRHRTLTDVKEIRALAHPVRVALLDALRREGTLTATEAGDLLDESPANCSFHLRTLAKYGYVEEAPGGTGRRRPWRRVGQGLILALEQSSPEVGAAAQELEGQFREQRRSEVEEWETTWQTYPQEWRDAAFNFHGLVYLTAAELTDLNGKILALVDSYQERLLDRSTRPEGVRPVSVNSYGHPLPLSKRGN